MSDTSDLLKCDRGDRVMAPAWLSGCPESWWEEVFYCYGRYVIATGWGRA